MTELSPRGGIDAKNDNCNHPTLDYSFKGMLLVEGEATCLNCYNLEYLVLNFLLMAPLKTIGNAFLFVAADIYLLHVLGIFDKQPFILMVLVNVTYSAVMRW